MSAVAFVDSNILNYAHDLDAGVKPERAAAKLRELRGRRTGRLSSQVLQELYLYATLTLNASGARCTAREITQTYGVWMQRATTIETVTRAGEISDLARISLLGCTHRASAEEVDADELRTEDLNAGQWIGRIKVVNPLRGAEGGPDAARQGGHWP